MPAPALDTTSATLEVGLSGLSQSYVQDLNTLIGLRIATPLGRDDISGNAWQRDSRAILPPREQNLRRQPGTEAKRGDTSFAVGTYKCFQNSKARPIPDVVRNAFGRDGVDLVQTAAQDLGFELALDVEKMIADAVTDETFLPCSGDTGATVSTWVDNASVDLVGIVAAGRESIGKRTNHWMATPNTKLVCTFASETEYQQACMSTQIRQTLGLQNNDATNMVGWIPEQLMAKALKVDEVLIWRAAYGGASGPAYIAPASRILLAVVDTSQSDAGNKGAFRCDYTTTEAGLMRMKSFREENKEQTVYEISNFLGVRQCFANAAYLIKKNGT